MGRPYPHGWDTFGAMRRNFILSGAVAAVVALCAAPAWADPAVLAQWNLNEGVGQVAADSSGNANHGTLGAAPDPDAADPGWIPGHAGGSALSFNGSSYVSIADTGLLQPPQLAVDAWVLRSGS